MDTSLVICSSPRSGGNWLAKLLHDRGMPLAKEYLSRHSHEFKNDVRKGNVAIKIHPSEAAFDDVVMDELINIVTERPILVLLERNNIDEQIESFAGARATGNWFKGSTRIGIQPTDFEKHHIMAERKFWHSYLSNKSHYTVYYEELVKDTDKVVNDIMTYIGANGGW